MLNKVVAMDRIVIAETFGFSSKDNAYDCSLRFLSSRLIADSLTGQSAQLGSAGLFAPEKTMLENGEVVLVHIVVTVKVGIGTTGGRDHEKPMGARHTPQKGHSGNS